ncbi:MAG: hypothetical protein ACE361_01275 [Aureliella sp.]
MTDNIQTRITAIPDEIPVEHEGNTYVWEFDDDEPSPEKAWRWCDPKTYMEPGQQIQQSLNDRFIRDNAPAILESLESNVRIAFANVLRSMGASKEMLCNLGQVESVAREDFEFAIRHVLSQLPAAARTLVNCPILRNQFFAANSARPFAYSVALIGNGPFTTDDLSTFLTSQGVNQHELSSATEVVVIGRTDWAEQEIDDLLDCATGRCLRFYSQEMFVSILAGQPDPFESFDATARNFGFNAFRAGHPALEYISSGWAGWVRAFVRLDRQLVTSGPTADRVDETPLHAMGYRVGKTGLAIEDRRALLASCFSNMIPIVDSPAYMESWGGPGSGDRLYRIARQLVMNIENFAGRSDSARYEQAIADWTDDLQWLHHNFYHGVFRFDWPRATV